MIHGDAPTLPALIIYLEWSRYDEERRELAGFTAAQGVRLCMLSGDAHMLAIDDGSHSGYAPNGGAGFPIFHAAPSIGRAG